MENKDLIDSLKSIKQDLEEIKQTLNEKENKTKDFWLDFAANVAADMVTTSDAAMRFKQGLSTHTNLK